MNYPVDLKYTKDHEWMKMEGDIAVIGISDFAQDALGDIVFINLPEVGDTVTAGESFGDVESVKAVSDVNSPVTGVVVEVNEDLADSPETQRGSLRCLDHQGRADYRDRGAAGRCRLRGILRRGGLIDGKLHPFHQGGAAGDAEGHWPERLP